MAKAAVTPLKYCALGNRLVVQKPVETKTDSGIVLAEQGTGSVFELEVIAAPEEHKRFLGRTILAERRHVVEFKEGEKIGAVKIEDILAIKE